MRNIFVLACVFFTGPILFSQTGPGGVGNNQGTSGLKLWFKADNGVSTTGALVDSWENSAGVAALNISETGGQRPTLVTNAVNGYSEVSFSGSNRLRTGVTLTTGNFVTNQASSFTVCRADNTGQTSCVYTTDPLVGSTRFSNHIPWSNTVYYDIGTCCGTDARIQVGSLTNLDTYSIWAYDASPALGKQLYRNGTQLQNRANTTSYSDHATHRFNIGGNTSGTNGFAGDVAEIIIFNVRINSAQRIIIDNYLAAKYGLSLSANDTYDEDNAGNGNYDHEVAGIGRVDASNIHNDAQGDIVRILNPTDLGDDEFLMWGHDNGVQQATNTTDIPAGVAARFNRVWRVSERNAANTTGVNVGDIDMRWDLSGLGSVTASDLRLLIDDDNDGIFSDETPISGAVNLGGGIFEFQSVPGGAGGIRNNRRFTLGTINSIQTPLPIELVSFDAKPVNNDKISLSWVTASEINNDFFTVEKSLDAENWIEVSKIQGAGNSNSLINYQIYDYQPYDGVSYYRLRQTDFDGQYSFSDIRSVKISPENSIKIYPNPTKHKITIEGDPIELSQIKIFNVLGQDVTVLTELSNLDDSKSEINLSNLSSGLYYIKTKTTASKIYKE